MTPKSLIVGREPELAQLTALLDGLERGDAACVTVEGEPGIGKTRLLAELKDLAEDRGHIVLSGTAAEFERDLPFGVFVDALDAYVVSHDLGAHDGWDDDLAGELGQVLPGLRRADSGGEIPDERYRTHRAISRLLTLIASARPVVLVLDDLHWCDGASVELITALVRRPPTGPVLLALGFRPGPAAGRLVTAGALTRLIIGELTEGEASTLLGTEDIKTIYSHGGGNPFHLQQLSRLHESDLGRVRRDRAGGVPPAVAAAIAAELSALPERTRSFLDAAAVAGEPFEPSLAAAIAGLTEADGLEALDDLLDVDLVRPTDVPRRFSFRHPLVRNAVYESTRGGWRLAAHERAAATLASRGAAAAERAHHVEESAGQGDEAAIAVLLDAGRAAAARAPASAARWFGAALRLLPDDDVDRQVDIRIELASARRALGALEECRATLLEAIDRLDAAGSGNGEGRSVRQVELTTFCAAVEHWLGRHDEAHRRLVRAWEDLPQGGTPQATALQVELAVDGLYTNDFDQVFTMGRAALEAARALDDRGLIAVAASALALGEVAAGEVAPARDHRDEALAQIDRMVDRELVQHLETLYYLGWAENYLEHYDEAIAHADRGVAIARSAGQGRLLVPLTLLKCYPLEMQGRLAEAIEVSSTAAEVARLSANPHFLFWALFELAWARYFAGDLNGAIAAGEESAQVGGRLWGGTMPSAGGGPGWALAVCHFELGEVERARSLMYEVGGPDMTHWIPTERHFNWENVAQAELAVGNVAVAETIAQRTVDAAATTDLQLPTTLATRTRAAVALATGDPGRAVLAAEESIAAGTAIGATLQVGYSRALLGQALAGLGERARAIAVLREAEAELDACGSVRMRDECRRELRKLGARAEVRGPSAQDSTGLSALSRRELEISELITDRLTNKQIAAQLFLSEKTIESHVRSVFQKLGASSRVDVARMIERHRREQSTAE